MKKERIKMILSLGDERIVTRIADKTCYDEPNLFGVDVNTVRVICGGLNASKLNEGKWKVITTVKLFDRECPKSVIYDCIRSVIRSSFTRYGMKPTVYRTCFDAVVCIPSKECDEDDLVIFRSALMDEGAVNVSFVVKSIEEVEDQMKTSGNALDDREVKIQNSVRPFWGLFMIVFTPWIVYAPLCIIYGGFEICIKAWLSFVLFALAMQLRRKRRSMASRIRTAGLTLPKKIRWAKIFASLAVVVMVILTLCVLCIKGRCHELRLLFETTLLLTPATGFFFERYAIEVLKKNCHELDRKMIIEINKNK